MRNVKEQDIPIRVVDLEVLAEKLLLARLVGQMSSYEITVFLGLEGRDEVDAAPHLFAGEFAVVGWFVSYFPGGWYTERKNELLLPDADNQLVPAVGHDQAGAEEEGARAEAARGEVALVVWLALVNLSSCDVESRGWGESTVFRSILCALPPPKRHHPHL